MIVFYEGRAQLLQWDKSGGMEDFRKSVVVCVKRWWLSKSNSVVVMGRRTVFVNFEMNARGSGVSLDYCRASRY